MKIVFSWFDFLIHGWFIKIFDDYFEEMNIPKKVWHFYRNNLKTEKDLVWTNESRCESLDYELFYRQFDKVYYFIRNPIDAMLTYYLWVDEGIDLYYFNEFVENHMIEYITHYKCHKKITSNIIKIEDLQNNFDFFLIFVESFMENIDKDILYKVYSKNRAPILEKKNIKKEIIEYIIKTWEEHDLKYEWKK